VCPALLKKKEQGVGVRAWLLLMSVAFGSASAAELDVGVGVGAGMDLVDPASGTHTRFGPGPVIAVPVRFELSPRVHARANAVFEIGVGTDRYTWSVGVAGEDVRLATDGHFALASVGGATVGTDVVLLDGSASQRGLSMYAGVGLGGAWVGTFHSFDQDSVELMDQEKNDLNDPNNLDPYSSQGVWLTEVRAGVEWGETPRAYLELSFGGAWVAEASLRKTYDAYDVKRSAYGWTPVRLVGGVWF
jgi:hypothetical protein